VKIRKVCICGFGLIGGSIALDLLRRKGSFEIVAHDRPKVLERVRRDRRFRVTTESRLKAAVAGADIVVLAASQTANRSLLKRLAAGKNLTDCLILDTGSVKAPIAMFAGELDFPDGTAFVPSHPMAGKERSGFGQAEAGLFAGKSWFVDDTAGLDDAMRSKLTWLLGKTKATPVFVGSELHDELVAELSHLPQLIATILGAQINSDMVPLAGSGLQSVLRLAGSPYSMWAEIIEQNREKIVEALTLYRDNLDSVIAMIETDQSLEDIFKAAARSYRCLS